jgi:hypothetical protein
MRNSKTLPMTGGGLALAVLLGFLYWAEERYLAPLKPGEWDLALTFCAWCVRRDGDDYTQPSKPRLWPVV